eukprot:GEMP01005009.1.p1 GENE.GEMP01005009.1~~GEMP01005009.1.p1  ORF type:complete len:677 (+),score=158.74 GEMP01005009.1:302-2332(+)
MIRSQTACAMKGSQFPRITFSTKWTQFPSASSVSSRGTSHANGMRRPSTAGALRTPTPALSHTNLEILNTISNSVPRPQTAKPRKSTPSLSRASLPRSTSSLLPASHAKTAAECDVAKSAATMVRKSSVAAMDSGAKSAVMQPDMVESPSKSCDAVNTGVKPGSFTASVKRRPSTAGALRTPVSTLSQAKLDAKGVPRPETAKQRKAIPSLPRSASSLLPATQAKPCADSGAAKPAVAPSAAKSTTAVVGKPSVEEKAAVTRPDVVDKSPAKSEAKTADAANTAAPSVLLASQASREGAPSIGGKSGPMESPAKSVSALQMPSVLDMDKSAPQVIAATSDPSESSAKSVVADPSGSPDKSGPQKSSCLQSPAKSTLSRQKLNSMALQSMSKSGSRASDVVNLRIEGAGLDEEKRKLLSRPKSAPIFNLWHRLERQSYMLPSGERKNSPQLWGSGPPRAGATRLRWDNRFDAKSGVFDVSKSPATLFKKIFERGDLPCQLKHAGATLQIDWKVGFDNMDLDHYLPLFIDGIRERSFPCCFFSLQGSFEIIRGANPSSLALTVRKLILPLKDALNTREPGTVVKALRILKELLICVPLAGERLVPYYRQLLPVVAIFRTKRRNLGDAMDFAQTKQDGRTLDSQIEEVLQLLEENGGEDAFINIKYMIPTYESCRLLDG